MTLGLARAATNPEKILFRTPGKKSRYYAAVFQPRTIYTARINQVFTSWNGILSITFDGGAGTLANVFPDMLMYIGTTAGARDVGTVRVRGTDATHFYIEQTSGVKFMDNQYLTVVDDFRLFQRHVNIVAGVTYMDGSTAYTNQHSSPDPTPIMGGHRILELTGAEVTATYDWSKSYMIDGTSISTYATTCPTAASIDNASTTTPTIHFNACGWHAVYLNLTAANGKSFFGVRYVFVWNAANMPHRVKIGNINADVNSGGWQFDIEVYKNATVSNIVEGALVLLFSKDYWGDTVQSIGSVDGSENIEAVGWIGSPENIVFNPRHKTVKFSVYGAHWWMQKLSAYPDGVKFKISSPTTWEYFQNLTVDKGVWHFLHWRTTATRVMDCFLSGDTKFTGEVASQASDIWSQIQEMGALQIMSRPTVNAQGQLFTQVHPQLTPEASRTWANVMDITTKDWIGEINIPRVVDGEVAQENLSGVAVDASGANGLSFFSVAPGNTYERYGKPGTTDNLLVSSQAQLNTLTGLFFNWSNNEYPDISITLNANNRLIDIAPNQTCSITINAGDTARGIAYSGKLIPKSISVTFDDKTGRAYREVVFEAEVFEGLAVTEIIQGSDSDLSSPPSFSFPPLNLPPVLLPGTQQPASDAPKKILVWDSGSGINPSTGLSVGVNLGTTPEYYTVNNGLTTTQYQTINRVVVCKNGSVYVGCVGNSTYSFIARAPYVGGTFTVIYDQTSLNALFPPGPTMIVSFACNPLVSEQVGLVLNPWGLGVSDIYKTYLGSGGTFTLAGTIGSVDERYGQLSYGNNSWILTCHRWSFGPRCQTVTLNAGLTAATAYKDLSVAIGQEMHRRAGTSGIIFHPGASTNRLELSLDNDATTSLVGSDYVTMPMPDDSSFAVDPSGKYIMCGRATTNKGKSSDGGYTLTDIASLPFVAQWCFDYAGGVGTASRWVAGSSYLRYSNNFGTSWVDVQGNMPSINPTYYIKLIRVLEY